MADDPPPVDTGLEGLDLSNLGGTKPDPEIVEAAFRAAQEAMRNK